MKPRPKSMSAVIEQPLTIEQELRRMMDRELASVLRSRGLDPRASGRHQHASSESSSSSASSSSSSIASSSSSATRSPRRTNRASTTSSLPLSASASAPAPAPNAFSLTRKVASSPVVPSPLGRSSSSRSSKSTQSTHSNASTVKTRAAPTPPHPNFNADPGAKAVTNVSPSIDANAFAKRISRATSLSRIGRWFRPRNSSQ